MANQEIIGLSRELIIHPGETLNEVITDRNISQKELAIRTGVSEKHVSTVINGIKPISTSFARKLEYAIGISASFWINLQNNYDCELLEYEDIHNISREEYFILNDLKKVIEDWNDYGWVKKDVSLDIQVMAMRKLLGVTSLCSIPSLSNDVIFKSINNDSSNIYVLYAWQRMCELLTDTITIADRLDIDILKGKIIDIKKTMFLEEKDIEDKLCSIFAECGIAFSVVNGYEEVPVLGLIKRRSDENLVVCVTKKSGYDYSFWFALFHEIAHVIYNDTKINYVDFENNKNKVEERANKFASDALIPSDLLDNFISNGIFTDESIDELAKECFVPISIVEEIVRSKNLI